MTSGLDQQMAFDACAKSNAQLHFEKWDVQLPIDCVSEAVRVDWPLEAGGEVGLPSASILKGAHWARVHSARHPVEEARRWVQQELGDRTPGVVCVIGAGLGYVVEALLDRSASLKVLALEPEPGLVPWLLARRDWSEAIRAGRLLIVPGPAFEQRMSAWRMLSPLPDSMPVLTSPVIAEARPEAVAAAREVATVALKGAIANAFAGDRFAGTMLLSTLRNLPAIAREAPFSGLLGLFRGKVAVVAGAGPSLNRNIEELRPHRDHVVLVAAGTALKPLVAAGLAPDFAVAVDPGEYTQCQFGGVIAPDTFLAADASIDPTVFGGFAGRTFVFRVSQTEPWPWLMDHGVDPGQLRSWGSVITSALHLAVWMACDPVVFIGTDLAYTGGQSHARGTFTHGWVKQWMAERGTPEVEDWTALLSPRQAAVSGLDGTPLSTSPIMLQFRDWLCHESCVLPITLVNATGAGILRGGRIVQGAVGAAVAGHGRVRRDRIRERHRETAGSSRTGVARACRELGELPATWTALGDAATLQAAIATAQGAVGEG